MKIVTSTFRNENSGTKFIFVAYEHYTKDFEDIR